MNEKYYEVNGTEINVETKNSVAKTVVVPNTEEIRYYIKTYNNRLVNPNAADFFRTNGKLSKWTKVTSHVFGMYLKFLQTGTERYFNYASRSL